LFKVTLAVENEYGCRDTSVRYIYVDYKTTIYFPNSFTPNDDGLNDAFGPISQGVQTKDFKLLVFARSGDLVYETDNPDHPWDGTDVITGGKYPTDTYVYRVYYRTFKGQKRELYGYVNLIR
jgi:gliding motility-associated-like protein